jgi:activator of Hsp90 ATPase-like protein
MTDQLPTHPVEATLDRSDDRWVLQMERTLDHPAERVWAALTRADEVRRWAPYAPDRDLDVVGAVPLPQAEGGEPADGPAEPGEVLVADPPRLLVWTGVGTCCVSRSHLCPPAYGSCLRTRSTYMTRRPTTPPAGTYVSMR